MSQHQVVAWRVELEKKPEQDVQMLMRAKQKLEELERDERRAAYPPLYLIRRD
ncbi:MAG: hypothetical protein ABW252_22190 [Polyangiales bacterium]